MEVFIILVIPAILLLGLFQQTLEKNRLLKAQLFLQIHEKLRKDAAFVLIERLLDDSESFNFNRLLEEEKEAFEHYLGFFESLVVMKIPNRFDKQEAELLFGRPAELLNRHYLVRRYVAEHYTNLDHVLTLNAQEKKKLSAG